jgi:hypothetical protein
MCNFDVSKQNFQSRRKIMVFSNIKQQFTMNIAFVFEEKEKTIQLIHKKK